jgi:nucleosome assembly protein 1-like 1
MAGNGPPVVEDVGSSSDEGGDETPTTVSTATTGFVGMNLGGGAGSAGGFNFQLADNDEDDEEFDEEEDMMAMLPPNVVRRVGRLKELHAERETLMEAYQAERSRLEQKYASLCKPLYDKRLEVVSGNLDQEIDDAAIAVGEIITQGEDEEEGEIVGVPQFWVCAMGHMQAVAELITEGDVDCLESLVNITCEDDEDGGGFTIKFVFAPNDYFHNDLLTKRYEIPNLLLDDEPILKNVMGCDISWKEGKCLTHKTVTKKQRSKAGKHAGQIRSVSRKEVTESFFHFFKTPKMPSMSEMDEEKADAIEAAFDRDYDAAQAFRSHIIPKAVLWFTGEVRNQIYECCFVCCCNS